MLKSLDKKGRWRNITVGFRLSSEESEELNTRVRLSGLTKQDYIMKCLSERDVIVQPNSRLFKALREQMTEILTALKEVENGSGVDDELIETIRLVAKTYNGLQEK